MDSEVTNAGHGLPLGAKLFAMQPFHRWMQTFLAVILSLLGALFGVLNILFSDIFGVHRRLLSYLFVVLVYAISGCLLAVLWPKRSASWARWLGIPAVLVALLMTISTPEQILTGLGAASFAVLGAWGGVAFGVWLRRRGRGTIQKDVPGPARS